VADLHRAIQKAAKGKGHRFEWPDVALAPVQLLVHCTRCLILVRAVEDVGGARLDVNMNGVALIGVRHVPPCKPQEPRT
jgi:hypothetical protein